MIGLRVGLATGVRAGLAGGVSSDSITAGGDEVIVFIGQSNIPGMLANASGLSDQSLRANYPAVRYRAHLANNADPPSVEEFAFGDLRELFYVNTGAFIVGADVTFGRAMDGVHPNRYAISKYSGNGTTLATQWLPTALYPTTPPNLFTQSVIRTRAVMAQAGARRVAAFVWIQGEQDAGNEAMSLAYCANMLALQTAYRAEFGNVPWLYNRLNAACIAPYTSNVRAQQELFLTLAPWSTMIDSDIYSLLDGYHYNADNITAMGSVFATALIAAQRSTTMTATLAESPNPITSGGQALAYTLNVANTGTVDATAVYANVTLPTGCTYVSAGSGGTGWTMSSSGQVVTAARSSMAAGAAPTITVNATGPSSGTSMTCNASVVASNVPAPATDSEVTTLSLPLAMPAYQAAGASTTGAGALSPAWPTHQTDDIAIMVLVTYLSATDPGVPVLSTPAGFTLIDSKLSTYSVTFLARTSAFWCRATSSAMAAPTVTDTYSNAIAQIITVRGCTPTGSPIDVQGTAFANNAYAKAVTLPGATTTGNDRLIVAVWGGYAVSVSASSGEACAALSSVTERTDVFGTGCNLETGTGGLAVAGAYGNWTATMSGDSVLSGFTLALKP